MKDYRSSKGGAFYVDPGDLQRKLQPDIEKSDKLQNPQLNWNFR